MAYPDSGSEQTADLSIHLRAADGIPYAAVRTDPNPRRRRWLWIGALVTAVALIGVGVAVLSGDTAVPEGGPRAADQAKMIDGLLDASAEGRGYLATAIDDINACHTGGSTVSYIRAAAAARQDLLGRVNQAVVTDMPYGNEIKTNLALSMRASYDADRAYLAWVLAAGDKCATHADRAFVTVTATNAAAQRAKKAFVRVWNPVARKYHCGERSITVI